MKGKILLTLLLLISSISFASSCIRDEKAYGYLEICPENLTAISAGEYSGVLKNNLAYDTQVNVSFEFPERLLDGKMFAWLNYTHPRLVAVYENKTFNSTEYNISNYTILLSPPPYCNRGALHPLNNRWLNYTQNGTDGQYACLNSTQSLGNSTFKIGWWLVVFDRGEWRNETYEDWKDETDRMDYFNRTLTNGSVQHVYRFKNIGVEAGGNITAKWWFSVGFGKKVKFNAAGYKGDIYSDDGTEVFRIDPTFDSSGWSYYLHINVSKAIRLENSQYILLLGNSTNSFNYSHANGDGSDLRVVFNDSVSGLQELGIFIENWTVDGVSAIHFNTSNATGQHLLYYGNPAASGTSDPQAVYLIGDSFPLYANGTHAINTSKWAITGTLLDDMKNAGDYINITNVSTPTAYFAITSLTKHLANETFLIGRMMYKDPSAANRDILFGWMNAGADNVNSTHWDHQPAIAGDFQLWYATDNARQNVTLNGQTWISFLMPRISNQTKFYAADYDNLRVSDLGNDANGLTADGIKPISFQIQGADDTGLTWLALDWLAIGIRDWNIPQPDIFINSTEFSVGGNPAPPIDYAACVNATPYIDHEIAGAWCINGTTTHIDIDTIQVWIINSTNSYAVRNCTGNPSSCAYAWETNKSFWGDGAYRFNITANDTAGNRNSTANKSITLNNSWVQGAWVQMLNITRDAAANWRAYVNGTSNGTRVCILDLLINRTGNVWVQNSTANKTLLSNTTSELRYECDFREENYTLYVQTENWTRTQGTASEWMRPLSAYYYLYAITQPFNSSLNLSVLLDAVPSPALLYTCTGTCSPESAAAWQSANYSVINGSDILRTGENATMPLYYLSLWGAPQEEEQISGGSGAGAGAGAGALAAIVTDIIVSPLSVSLQMERGTEKAASFNITNRYGKTITAKFSSPNSWIKITSVPKQINNTMTVPASIIVLATREQVGVLVMEFYVNETLAKKLQIPINVRSGVQPLPSFGIVESGALVWLLIAILLIAAGIVARVYKEYGKWMLLSFALAGLSLVFAAVAFFQIRL